MNFKSQKGTQRVFVTVAIFSLQSLQRSTPARQHHRASLSTSPTAMESRLHFFVVMLKSYRHSPKGRTYQGCIGRTKHGIQLMHRLLDESETISRRRDACLITISTLPPTSFLLFCLTLSQFVGLCNSYKKEKKVFTPHTG